MRLLFGTRPSESSWIRSVWTCASGELTEMTSVASPTWGLVFWEQAGRAHAAVTGPETGTATAPVPEGAAFTGIEFAVGTSLRAVATRSLVNGGIALPDTTRRSFRLGGRRWETPGPDDAEALVRRLVGDEIVIRDPLLAPAKPPPVGERTLERRFRAATGLTRGAVRQIVRARTAAERLASGAVTGDVVAALGFYDEPHLARALRRYIGWTATQLREGRGGAIALDLDAQRTTS
ncbi:helix-turn-helix domain-containing protein [Phytomonospora endophytica]|uniref:HTH araC/xylS-type domain-containing protein n=1 Tax=Phytomonospora endophytica TaxID=714109 RepID=A0A841FPB3_9ACTN|nr:helix-turn-helix domain-containing protein [Phytomonospora endophytica]MBB6037945.1 hypothetical protein [Phytomonospora endophytica]GIG68845.1 AraC family transcriptional regulator [Phytomonospora endophytica]